MRCPCLPGCTCCAAVSARSLIMRHSRFEQCPTIRHTSPQLHTAQRDSCRGQKPVADCLKALFLTCLSHLTAGSANFCIASLDHCMRGIVLIVPTWHHRATLLSRGEIQDARVQGKGSPVSSQCCYAAEGFRRSGVLPYCRGATQLFRHRVCSQGPCS
jgi:hypothetical protein